MTTFLTIRARPLTAVTTSLDLMPAWATTSRTASRTSRRSMTSPSTMASGGSGTMPTWTSVGVERPWSISTIFTRLEPMSRPTVVRRERAKKRILPPKGPHPRRASCALFAPACLAPDLDAVGGTSGIRGSPPQALCQGTTWRRRLRGGQRGPICAFDSRTRASGQTPFASPEVQRLGRQGQRRTAARHDTPSCAIACGARGPNVDAVAARAGSRLAQKPQVPDAHRVAEEEAQRGTGGQEGAERHHRAAVAAAAQQDCAPQRTQERRNEDRQEHTERTEERADHAGELDVAEALALGAARRLVERRDAPDAAGAGGGAERTAPRSNRQHGGGEQQPEPQDTQRQHVGDDHVLPVDPRDGEERRQEDEVRGRRRRRAEAQHAHDGERTRGELDERIAPGDRRPAAGAAPPQQEPRHDWNVLPGAHRALAMRATRAAAPRRLGTRQTVNEHVQEAADDEA